MSTPGVEIPIRGSLPPEATLASLRVICGSDGRCGPEDDEAVFEAVAGWRAGDRVTRDALVRAAVRLWETRFFASVALEVEGPADALDVRFVCTPAVTIQAMRIESGLALASEIRRRLFLRAGQHWTGDARVRTRQEDALRDYFRIDGYFDSTVQIHPVSLGPDRVRLDVRVRRGGRRRVGTLHLRGVEAMPWTEARDVLQGEFNLLRTYTQARFERAQEALLRHYRDRGLLQARVVYDEPVFRSGRERPRLLGQGGRPSSGTVDLFLEVREGPRWRLDIRGNRAMSDRDIRSRLTFLETGFIDDEEIRLAVRSIETRYETIGHYFAEVTPRQQTGVDGVRELALDIREGPTAEVRSIRFEGLSGEVDPERLGRELGTAVYDVVSSGGYAQRALLDQDVEAIEAFFQRAGWLSARVSRVTLVADDGGRDLHITFHIDQGVQTRVTSVDPGPPATWSGAGPPDLRTRRGRAFSVEDFRTDLGRVSQAWRQRGHHDVQVEGHCLLPDGREVPCEAPAWPAECRWSLAQHRQEACQRTTRAGIYFEECILLRPDPACVPQAGIEGPQVALRLDVTPGTPSTFGEVLFRGDFRTRRGVLERELPFATGDPFVYESLLRGQANLRFLRIFDSVRADTLWEQPEGSPDNVAHVLIQLEESRARTLDHRIALESRVTPQSDVLLIFANEPTWRHINFLGRGEELRLTGNFGLDILRPERVQEGEWRGSVSLIYIDPRMYLGRVLKDPWELRAELAARYDLLAVAPAPLRRTLEASVRVREQFDNSRGIFLDGTLSVRRTNVLDQSDSLTRTEVFEPALILSVTPRVTLERRDNPLNPTRGHFAQVQLELADDFLGVLNSARFVKLTTRASGYLPLGRGFTFGSNARVGAATGGLSQGFRSADRLALPLSERFALGGVTSIRGFAEGEIASIATEEFGGDVVVQANMELRYPFSRVWGLYGATFVDAGQIAPDVGALRPEETRVTAGLGLRFVIAELLPVLMDYGAVLGRRPGERFGRLHFNIGYTF
jgi:outer membrane protein assembly factor BamA